MVSKSPQIYQVSVTSTLVIRLRLRAWAGWQGWWCHTHGIDAGRFTRVRHQVNKNERTEGFTWISSKVEDEVSTVYPSGRLSYPMSKSVSQSVSTPASGLKLGLHPFRTVLGSPRLARAWPEHSPTARPGR